MWARTVGSCVSLYACIHMNEYECMPVCTESCPLALGPLAWSPSDVPSEPTWHMQTSVLLSFLRQHCGLCSPLTEHRRSHTLKSVCHQMWITYTWMVHRVKLLEVCRWYMCVYTDYRRAQRYEAVPSKPARVMNKNVAEKWALCNNVFVLLN